MTTVYYPPPAFYFSVGLMMGGSYETDSRFQEVSGIQAEFDTENVVEGGENRFTWRLPRQVKYPNLVLKRGLVPRDSRLGDWVYSTLTSGLAVPIQPKDLMVTLLNSAGVPLISWSFVRAWPLRWELGRLDAAENNVLIETLELSYNFFGRLLGPPPKQDA